MQEFRAIIITVVAGTVGVLAGVLTTVGLTAWIDLAALPFVTPAPSDLGVVLSVAGLIFAPAIALSSAGFDLAKVTAALAGLWMVLLVASVGPLLEVVGPPLFPFALAPAALIIARVIAGPFAPYIAGKPTAVATFSR